MRLSLQKTLWVCVGFVVIALVVASVQRVQRVCNLRFRAV